MGESCEEEVEEEWSESADYETHLLTLPYLAIGRICDPGYIHAGTKSVIKRGYRAVGGVFLLQSGARYATLCAAGPERGRMAETDLRGILGRRMRYAWGWGFLGWSSQALMGVYLINA